jgi:hypothetical protein
VSESRSLEQGKEQITKQRADACLLGSSLKASVTEQFIRESKADEASSQCAFLALVDSSSASEPCTNADAVISKPYEVENLRDAVILAIASANPSSDFATAFFHRSGSDQAEATSESVKETSSLSLESILKKHRSGEYGLLSNGKLSAITRGALDEVIEQLLAPKSLSEAQYNIARKSLQTALSDWFIEVALGSETTAAKLLREKLKKLL